jgi:cell filamentation protein
MAQFLDTTLRGIEVMPEDTFEKIAEKYIEMNIAHPFMEGNGRSARIWLDLMLKKNIAKCVDWSQIGKDEYMNAMIESPSGDTRIIGLLRGALTDDIHSREMYMK